MNPSKQAFLDLIHQEVVPALGCTEPIAVALTAAKAAETLGTVPERLCVEVSANLLKNGMGVMVPGTGEMGLNIAAAAGALAAFLSRKFYDHYLILGAPMAVLGMAAALAAIQKPRTRAVSAIALTCCCALWLGINGHAANQTRLSERADWAQFTADAQALMAQVPQDERNRFMAYRVEPRWYVAAEALPCMRFYFLQEVLAQADPAVMDEIVQTFEADPPCSITIAPLTRLTTSASRPFLKRITNLWTPPDSISFSG